MKHNEQERVRVFRQNVVYGCGAIFVVFSGWVMGLSSERVQIMCTRVSACVLIVQGMFMQLPV